MTKAKATSSSYNHLPLLHTDSLDDFGPGCNTDRDSSKQVLNFLQKAWI